MPAKYLLQGTCDCWRYCWSCLITAQRPYDLKFPIPVQAGLRSPGCFAVDSQGFAFLLCSLLSWGKLSACSYPNATYHRHQKTLFHSAGNCCCFVPTCKDLPEIERFSWRLTAPGTSTLTQSPITFLQQWFCFAGASVSNKALSALQAKRH